LIQVNYIKYKFTFNNNIKHSSYLYQKIFRSIYGYQQNVTKSNKKVYTYKRPGIISNTPHIKPGKNSIILPIGCEANLIEFFNTGKNPAHNWRNKGDWEVNYSINKIDVPKESIIIELEEYIRDYKVINFENKESTILIEINKILNKEINDVNYMKNILKISNNIILYDWFKDTYIYSDFLNKFHSDFLKLDEVVNIK
jgi:hypothetical protein